MARRIYLWLPCLTVLALSACGGSDTGFFSPVFTAGAGGSSHAGASSNAGSTSSAGSPSHAGSPDSAGQSSAGGESGGAGAGGANSGGANSGGNAGTTPSGGASGGGARAGAGGSVASGGRAGANGGSTNAGAGGSKPDPTCNELIKQANQQLETARECNLNADALQCTGKVSNQCGCQVPVQRTDSAATKAYLKTLQLLEDKDCIIACTAVACPSVANADCKASGTGSMGTCVSTGHDWTR